MQCFRCGAIVEIGQTRHVCNEVHIQLNRGEYVPKEQNNSRNLTQTDYQMEVLRKLEAILSVLKDIREEVKSEGTHYPVNIGPG